MGTAGKTPHSTTDPERSRDESAGEKKGETLIDKAGRPAGLQLQVFTPPPFDIPSGWHDEVAAPNKGKRGAKVVIQDPDHPRVPQDIDTVILGRPAVKWKLWVWIPVSFVAVGLAGALIMRASMQADADQGATVPPSLSVESSLASAPGSDSPFTARSVMAPTSAISAPDPVVSTTRAKPRSPTAATHPPLASAPPVGVATSGSVGPSLAPPPAGSRTIPNPTSPITAPVFPTPLF